MKIETEKQRLLKFLDECPSKGKIFRRYVIPPYPSEFFQTLKNSNSADILYESGRNYLGTGYADLSPLLWGKFINEDNRKPILFYGYEASPVAALRSKVILELIKADNKDISTSSILQVILIEYFFQVLACCKTML